MLMLPCTKKVKKRKKSNGNWFIDMQREKQTKQWSWQWSFQVAMMKTNKKNVKKTHENKLGKNIKRYIYIIKIIVT